MMFASCDLLDNNAQGDSDAENVVFVMNSEIEFSSSASWKLVLEPASSTEWISVNRTAGQKGDSQVLIDIPANYSGQDRSATLTLIAGEESQAIMISQDRNS